MPGVAVGWWENGEDGPPIYPKVLMEFAPYGNTYDASLVQRLNSRYPTPGWQLMLSVGPLTQAQAQTICNNLANNGHPTGVIFRIMWEQNGGSGFPGWDYSSGWSAQTFITNFRNTATYLRQYMPSCKIMWCPNLWAIPGQPGYYDHIVGGVARTTYDTWPGRNYVDYAGWDCYDVNTSFETMSLWANTFIRLCRGEVLAGYNFGVIPWGVGEWGLRSDQWGPSGANPPRPYDDPSFIDLFASFFTQANNCAFHCYFASGKPETGGFVSWMTGQPPINGPSNPVAPLSRARYLANFPSDGGTWPPLDSPPPPPPPDPPPTGQEAIISSAGPRWSETYQPAASPNKLSVNPHKIGNAICVAIQTGETGGVHVDSLVGGGVTEWHEIINWSGAMSGQYRGLFWGVVTAIGPSDIIFNWSAPGTALHRVEYTAKEFTTGNVPAEWIFAGISNEVLNAAPALPTTPIPFPGLTPSNSERLYFGFMTFAQGPPTPPGDTPGYTYEITEWGNAIAWRTDCPASQQMPVAYSSPTVGATDAVAFMLRAVATGLDIASALHTLTSDSVTGLTQTQVLEIQDSYHQPYSDLEGALTPDNSRHNIFSTHITLRQFGDLVIDDSVHSLSSENLILAGMTYPEIVEQKYGMVWDKVGERKYETGLDRGVLYLPNGSPVPWNGLTSVIENFGRDVVPVYYDGMKISDLVSLGEFSATLKAVTYPEALVELEGMGKFRNNLFLGDQRPQTFGLCYRTKMGNDLEGTDAGYKIHILYNVVAIPSDRTYASETPDPQLVEFEWNISAVPEEVPGFRPTAHVVVNSVDVDPWLLEDLEKILYGSSTAFARLMPMPELITFMKEWYRVKIIDNGNGTWTAMTLRDEFIEFYTPMGIIHVNVEFLDDTTYRISDSMDEDIPQIRIIDNGDGTWIATTYYDELMTVKNDVFEIKDAFVMSTSKDYFTMRNVNATYLDEDTFMISDTIDVADVPQIHIIDNGDGTWLASTDYEDLISVTTDGYFEILNANAVFAGDSYQISDTVEN